MELHVLRRHGWSIAALAREFGLNWRTARRYASADEAPRYRPRTRPADLSAAQAAHVERRLAACPDLRATVLLRELTTEYGYTGSYASLRRRVVGLRPAVTSTCTGRCLTAWPPLTVTAGQQPTAGPGVTGHLGSFTRTDGTTQVTYNGWPLYSWPGDAKPGDATGQGVGGFSVATTAVSAPALYSAPAPMGTGTYSY